MKTFLIIFAMLAAACGGGIGTNNAPAPTPGPSKPMDGMPVRVENAPIPTPVIPKDGAYNGHGKVTKVSNDLGSIEIDHDDIPGMMPAMKMEFLVKDKAMLKGIFAGDEVNFVLEYKHPTETIVSIKKSK